MTKTRDRLDLRLVPLSCAVWLAAGVAPLLPLTLVASSAVGLAAAGVAVLGVLDRAPDRPRRRVREWARPVSVVLFGLAAGAVVSGLHVAVSRAGPVVALAEEGAVATVELAIRSDPELRQSRLAGRSAYIFLRAQITWLRARGVVSQVTTPVVVIAQSSWAPVKVGQRVRAIVRLAPADLGAREAAVVSARSPPEPVAEPGALDRAASHLWAKLRAAVAGLPEDERGLVPALVVGDTSTMPDSLVADMETAGLTHLTAVSGANLTILLIFVVGAGRRAGVRSWGIPVLGLVCVAGFVLVARPEPSVLRAAGMGLVGVVGTAVGSRRHGVPALAIAMIGLLLIDPWLGRSYGFALSVVATAGIVILARPWTDALAGWLPGWIATAIAVPLAAQLSCTPLVAVLSGQVSVVGVVANLLVGYAVFPATVLGVGAMIVAAVSVQVATVPGELAGWAARWIAEVGRYAADIPGASLSWPTTPPAVAGLAIGCLATILVAHRVLTRRGLTLALIAALMLWLVQPVPAALTPPWFSGWPPDGWILVACDVGQGDALVLRAGPSAAIVVDTGPDPERVDRCLDELGVRTVPYVLITHFHADHVGGLPGVLKGRSVGEVGVRPGPDPDDSGREVDSASAAGIPVAIVLPGERRRAGEVRWTVLGPAGAYGPVVASLDGEDSAENDASVVILAEVRGVRILLTGDVEPNGQLALLGSGVDLRADVLKVPHHGSRYQSAAFLAAVQPRVALVSSGEGNDYGHPAPSTLELLSAIGAAVLRTDQAGDIALIRTQNGLSAATTR